MRRSLPLLSASALAAFSPLVMAQSGSGSGFRSADSNETFVPSCWSTNASTVLQGSNFTMCSNSTGYDFASPRNDSDALAQSLCGNVYCNGVFWSVLNLNLTSDCQIAQNVLLLSDIISPMAPYCAGGMNISFYSAGSNNGSRSGSGSGSGSYGSNVGDFSSSDAGIIMPSVPASSSSSDNKTTIATIVSIAIAALLAFLAVLCAVVWYKRQSMRELRAAYADPFVVVKPNISDYSHNNQQQQRAFHSMLENNHTSDTSSTNDMALALQQPAPPSLHANSLWNDEELLAHHMRAEDIEDIHIIGNGGHGVVYLVRYRGSRLLASKRLVQDNITRQKTRLLIAEIKLVAKLDHPCIVQFVGAAWTTESDLQALFEYMPNGDMCTYLAKTSQQDESEEWDLTKIRIAMDVAEALVYVHSFVPALVHRDLKSRNILLGGDMRAKLTDFGVSRYSTSNHTMTTGVGTGRWLAPEVIAGGGEYDEKCDIYSLGMVLSELDTHRLPFASAKMPSGNVMPEIQVVQLVSQGKLQPTFRPSCPESLKAIALRCAAFNPKDRPSAIEVSYVLRTIARKEFGLY